MRIFTPAEPTDKQDQLAGKSLSSRRATSHSSYEIPAIRSFKRFPNRAKQSASNIRIKLGDEGYMNLV